MDVQLDVRFGVGGLELKNKDEVLAEANKIVADIGSISKDKIEDDETYKVAKECRKILKDDRYEIASKKKSSVNAFKEGFEADADEILAVFDKPISDFNDSIRAYETQESIGAAKAIMTKAANKAKEEMISDSLTLTIACPSKEAKDRIAQFAKDLGATVK